MPDLNLAEANLVSRMKGSPTPSQHLLNLVHMKTVQDMFISFMKLIMLAFFTSMFVITFNATYSSIPNLAPRGQCVCADGKSGTLSSTNTDQVKFVSSSGVKYCKVRDWGTPIMNDHSCLLMDIQPPTRVCVHEATKDQEVSARVMKELIWERTLVNVLQNVLNTDPAMGFIDIGSNIGVFSNLVANMDHKVVAVEPHPDHNLLCHLAVKENKAESKITLVQNAVSDSRGNYALTYYPGHMARAELSVPGNDSFPNNDGRAVTTLVDTIMTSDLLEVISFNKAVMKIDTESHEHRVMLGAAGLMDSVDIPFVFMQWDRMKVLCTEKGGSQESRERLARMMAMFSDRQYSPFTLHYQALTLTECATWDSVVMWRKA